MAAAGAAKGHLFFKQRRSVSAGITPQALWAVSQRAAGSGGRTAILSLPGLIQPTWLCCSVREHNVDAVARCLTRDSLRHLAPHITPPGARKRSGKNLVFPREVRMAGRPYCAPAPGNQTHSGKESFACPGTGPK